VGCLDERVLVEANEPRPLPRVPIDPVEGVERGRIRGIERQRTLVEDHRFLGALALRLDVLRERGITDGANLGIDDAIGLATFELDREGESALATYTQERLHCGAERRRRVDGEAVCGERVVSAPEPRLLEHPEAHQRP
jgi:hypothetical protein